LPQVISATEYSKRRGVAPTTISQAIAEGRLNKSVRRHGKGYLIDPELADAELAANNAPGRGGRREKGNVGMVTPPDSNTPPPDSFDSETETYTEAKTRHERLKADLAALDLAEKEGKLIEAAEVERERRRVALEVEAQLMRLPDRLAPVIAAEADVFKVHAIMTAAFRETLRRLSSEG
jgi:hypothetical protein